MKPSLQLTHVALRVSDLAASREFYVRRLGFVPIAESAASLELATQPDGAPILTLLATETLAPAPRDTAGLFHAALLLPSRAALASWLAFAAAHHLEFEGFSDHGVSEAIYFSDPDGNGLEFYADRPREVWPYRNGELAMITRPLDVRELLTHATPTQTPLAGATWGHLHLRVTDLERSQAFYQRALGLDVTQRTYPGARFLAADGYHHHLGINTWGNPRHPQPAHAIGLASATFARSDASSDTTLSDPDGIPLRVAPMLAAV